MLLPEGKKKENKKSYRKLELLSHPLTLVSHSRSSRLFRKVEKSIDEADRRRGNGDPLCEPTLAPLCGQVGGRGRRPSVTPIPIRIARDDADWKRRATDLPIMREGFRVDASTDEIGRPIYPASESATPWRWLLFRTVIHQ